LKLTWTGPVQIIEAVSEHIYKIQLPNGKAKEVHVCRLRGYCSKEELKELSQDHVTQFTFDAASFEVDCFCDLRFYNGHFEVLTRWRGFESMDDSWEPVPSLFADIPDFVVSYLQSLNSPLSIRCLSDVCGI
jgi:hypothetical protein